MTGSLYEAASKNILRAHKAEPFVGSKHQRRSSILKCYVFRRKQGKDRLHGENHVVLTAMLINMRAKPLQQGWFTLAIAIAKAQELLHCQIQIENSRRRDADTQALHLTKIYGSDLLRNNISGANLGLGTASFMSMRDASEHANQTYSADLCAKLVQA